MKKVWILIIGIMLISTSVGYSIGRSQEALVNKNKTSEPIGQTGNAEQPGREDSRNQAVVLREGTVLVDLETFFDDNPIDEFYDHLDWDNMVQFRSREAMRAESWKEEVKQAFGWLSTLLDEPNLIAIDMDDFMQYADAECIIYAYHYASDVFDFEVRDGYFERGVGNAIVEGYSMGSTLVYKRKLAELWNIIANAGVEIYFVFDADTEWEEISDYFRKYASDDKKLLFKSLQENSQVEDYFNNNPIDPYFKNLYAYVEDENLLMQYARQHFISWDVELNHAYRLLYDASNIYGPKTDILDSQRLYLSTCDGIYNYVHLTGTLPIGVERLKALDIDEYVIDYYVKSYIYRAELYKARTKEIYMFLAQIGYELGEELEFVNKEFEL